MTFEITKNPRRAALAKLSSSGGSFRAIRNPATGDIYAWPANDALHADVAQKLGLDFKTRRQVQENSYLFSRGQLDELPEARDLDDLVKMIGGG